MKKLLKFKIAFIALLVPFISNAQWARNALTAKTYLTYSGDYVGIGTSTPETKLQIIGGANAGISGGGYIVAGALTGYNLAIDRDEILARNNGGTSILYLNSAGGNVSICNTSGNVGIGTSTPHATLQFANILANRKVVLYETTNNDHQYYGFGVNNDVMRYQVSNTSANHIFYAGSGATSSVELMRIQGNGKVGIGTSSPSEMLSVKALNNSTTTNIATFKSLSGKNGLAIRSNSIIPIGSSKDQDLNLYALGTGTIKPRSNIIMDNKEISFVSALCPDCGKTGNCCRGGGGIPPPPPTGYGAYLYLNRSEGFFPIGFSNADSGFDSVVVNILTKPSTVADIIGVQSTSAPTPGHGIGVDGIGGLIGVRGTVESNSSTSGVQYGGVFSGWGSGTGARYGVFASAPPSGWAIYSNGPSQGTGFWTMSDVRLKKNITPLENTISKIMQLHPSSYNFKTDEFAFMNLPQEKQYGLLAQDLEKVFPEMVREIQQPIIDKKGIPTNELFTFKGVNYDQLIAVLISAIQEQNNSTANQLEEKNEIIKKQEEKINLLTTRMDQFENDLMNCCNNFKEASGKGQESKITDAPSLEQNTPNPFSENTIIKFYLPATVANAALKIISLNGETIKLIPLDKRGVSSIVISENSLSAGSYIYNLIVDGKAMDSKLMTLTK